ncbi:MAG: SGNH/GDSL hydrolase family protein, partial [Bacteroidota bacterium]
MKQIFAILFFFTGSSSSCSKKDIADMPNPPMAKQYTYLALGDSYTIGESVPATDNFPTQVAALIQNDTVHLQSPRIIARTG